jgi:predicted RNase H-like HicB family nuclease
MSERSQRGSALPPYRVGWPLWKHVAKAGIPVTFRVFIRYDAEVQRYWASSPDLDGLVVEGGTLDELLAEIRSASETLFELALDGPHGKALPELRFRDMAIGAA